MRGCIVENGWGLSWPETLNQNHAHQFKPTTWLVITILRVLVFMAMGGDPVRMQKKPSRESETKTQTKQTNPADPTRYRPVSRTGEEKGKKLETPGG